LALSNGIGVLALGVVVAVGTARAILSVIVIGLTRARFVNAEAGQVPRSASL
jgi:hypothetical protein